MNRLSNFFSLIQVLYLGLFVSSCSYTLPTLADSRNTTISPSPPGTVTVADWDAVQAEIDKFAAANGVQSLRQSLSVTDTELRFWIGFGPDKTRGLILRDQNGSIHALLLQPLSTSSRASDHVVGPDGERQMGELIGSLEATGFFKERRGDMSMEPREDSEVLILETASGGNYVISRYASPCLSTGPEAKRIVGILNEFQKTFDVSLRVCG
jgi:hypothetical protein